MQSAGLVKNEPIRSESPTATQLGYQGTSLGGSVRRLEALLQEPKAGFDSGQEAVRANSVGWQQRLLLQEAGDADWSRGPTLSGTRQLFLLYFLVFAELVVRRVLELYLAVLGSF